MSNIIFKGDAIKNFGEYLPNIYIDNVVVRNNGANAVFLDIGYSLFFHVTDEFNHEDISELLENVSFYFAISNRKDENKQLLTEEDVVSILKDSKSRILLGNSAVTNEELLELTMLYPFSKESIQQKLVSGEYTDDVYDSQERKVMIISAEETISVVTENKRERYFYLYAFTSLYDSNEFSRLNMLGENSDIIYSSAISNISYEKIFSPNFNIIPQTQVIYLDIEEAKYSDTPILGLNGLYYKNQTVTRELITDKVNELIGRFTTRLSLPRLTDATNSLKTVLQIYSNSENLLVEIERVRKSFPNKTNNNPTGNLYAALSRLIININSSFPPGEIVTKERMVTGKVIDRRGEMRFNIVSPVPTSEIFIPEDGFFIERTRLSSDEEHDLSSNSGFFHIRYEALLKNRSKISQLINLERFFNFPLPSLQEDLKKITFAHFKAKQARIFKYETATDAGLSSNGISYDSITRMGSPTRSHVPPGITNYTLNQSYESYLREYFLDCEGPTPEKITSYEFFDLDQYPAVYEMLQNDDGGMKFYYYILAQFDDKTLEIASILEKMFDIAIAELEIYFDYASEICSYNNIQNKFNNFFVSEIQKFYNENRQGRYPWSTSVYVYALMQYILTDKFSNIEDLVNYSKNLIKTISPSFGTLESVSSLLLEMQQFKDQVLGSGSDYLNKKIELSNTDNMLEIETTFYTNVITQNISDLQAEAQTEIDYFLDLFDASSFYGYLEEGSSDTLLSVSSRYGDLDFGPTTADLREFYLSQYASNVIYHHIDKIFENTLFTLEYRIRTSGDTGVSYNSVDGGDFTGLNLNDIDTMGTEGTNSGNLWKQLDLQSSKYRDLIKQKLYDYMANWIFTILRDAKDDRDTFLRSGGLGLNMRIAPGSAPGDRTTESGVDRTINLGYYYHQIDLEDVFKEAVYEALKQSEADRNIDINDIQNGSRSRVRSFVQDFQVTDIAYKSLVQIPYSIYAYYREQTKQNHLADDLLFSTYWTETPMVQDIVTTASELYNSQKDPVTELPDFIIDNNPYIKYTGPKLEDIPNLLIPIEDSGLE